MIHSAAGLLLLGMLCLSINGATHSRESSSTSAQLFAQFGELRPCEARLPEISLYAPYHRDRKISQSQMLQALNLSLSRATLRVWLARPSNQAVLHLIEGDFKGAVPVLESAAAKAPGNALLLSSLSAAYLALAEETKEPYWLIAGLAAADRAVKIAPNLPEPLFNRALGLEKLFLNQEAIRAWQGYLAVDSTSAWAEEARARVRWLRKPSEAELWNGLHDSVESRALSSDPSELRDLAARFRQAMRQHAEELLLARWGEAVLERHGEEAARLLTIARMVGKALVETHGDPMILDAVTAIDRASAAQSQSAVKALANAHRAFAHGLSLYRRDLIGSAQEYFLDASTGFVRGRSPMSAWADFYLAVCNYYGSRYKRVLADLSELCRVADLDRYPVLQGRILWMIGLTNFAHTNLRDSLMYFQESLLALERGGEPEHLAGIHFLLAENYLYSGERRRAWSHRYEALRLRAAILDPRRLTNILYDCADAAHEAGYPEVARHFHNEHVQVARRWGLPSEVAQALLHRSRTRALTADPEGAAEDLARAETSARQIAEASIRFRIEADILLAAAELQESSDPAKAIDDLSKALIYFRETGFGLDLTQILLARAHGYMQRGDDNAAERDFSSAIETHRERLSHALKGAAVGPVGYDAAQVYRAAIDFQARRRGRLALALDYAEEARARALIDNVVLSGLSERKEALVRSIEAKHLALTSDQIESALPSGTRIIEFVVLGEDLVAWTIERGSVRFHELKPKLSSLLKSIDKFRGEIVRGQSGGVAAEQLYSEVVAPLLFGLQPGSRLVFVPDGPLYQLPFSALRDPRSARYLVENFDITLAPSASLYVHGLRYNWPKQPSLLAIGSSRVDRSRHPWLPSLPGTEKEATAVASLYPRARVLLAQNATRSAILENLDSFEVVHFAGHSILNQEFPLESFLVLAPGGITESDELSAFDLYGRPFTHTRLVVLSSCSSAGGETQAFQGLIGFARAFIVNGVPAVLGTLLEVNDQTAAKFLDQFYRELREAGDPVSALSSSQRGFIRGTDAKLRLPKYWATFQLVGA
jgi:CHAT domain-containing protein